MKTRATKLKTKAAGEKDPVAAWVEKRQREEVASVEIFGFAGVWTTLLAGDGLGPAGVSEGKKMGASGVDSVVCGFVCCTRWSTKERESLGC